MRDKSGRNQTDGHGYAKRGKQTKVYQAWCSMKRRCSPDNKSHPQELRDYYERGIRVCERWEKFDNFLEDMGEPLPNQSLDRMDNDKGYEPGNCRWADRTTQNRNSRRCRLTFEDAVAICMERIKGRTIVSIGKQFGVTHVHVSSISRGELWKGAMGEALRRS
jgi:hypothetical protein